jgi:hypothetical protein
MLDDRTKALLRALLYPVQFERRPEHGIGRVIEQVIEARALHATPEDYLNAIRSALQSRDEKLSAIIPGTHTDEAIRSYLQQLSARFAVPLRAGATPAATW